MPESTMKTGGAVAFPNGPFRWHNLDAFTQGYVEACFFTESDPSASMADLGPGHEFIDGNIPADAGFSDIHPDSLIRISKDCERFQRENQTWLNAAYEAADYDAAQAGRDFWFTRNGHGVGFWDRRQLESPAGNSLAAIEAPAQWGPARKALFLSVRGKSLGDVLADACKAFGEISVTWGPAADGAASPTGCGFVFLEGGRA